MYLRLEAFVKNDKMSARLVFYGFVDCSLSDVTVDSGIFGIRQDFTDCSGDPKSSALNSRKIKTKQN